MSRLLCLELNCRICSLSVIWCYWKPGSSERWFRLVSLLILIPGAARQMGCWEFPHRQRWSKTSWWRWRGGIPNGKCLSECHPSQARVNRISIVISILSRYLTAYSKGHVGVLLQMSKERFRGQTASRNAVMAEKSLVKLHLNISKTAAPISGSYVANDMFSVCRVLPLYSNSVTAPCQRGYFDHK